jgi:hypothetical protein
MIEKRGDITNHTPHPEDLEKQAAELNKPKHQPESRAEADKQADHPMTRASDAVSGAGAPKTTD